MILVANKVDLVHQRKVTEEEGKALAADLGVRGQGSLRYISDSHDDEAGEFNVEFLELDLTLQAWMGGGNFFIKFFVECYFGAWHALALCTFFRDRRAKIQQFPLKCSTCRPICIWAIMQSCIGKFYCLLFLHYNRVNHTTLQR